MNLNKWMGIGRLTRDPESRNVGGTTVVKFGLAVNRRYKNRQDEWVDDPMFVDCEAWDTGADRIVERFKKGDLIFIDDGRLVMDSWEDKTTGQRRQKHFIRVNHFQSFPNQNASLDDANPEAEQAPAKTKGKKGKPAAEPEPQSDGNDVPF